MYNNLKLAQKIYVKNDDDYIYEVSSIQQLDSKKLSFSVNLSLVCGIDYINPDNNDLQGYVNCSRFIDDIQHDCFVWYPMEESLKEVLEYNDYQTVEKLPKIY